MKFSEITPMKPKRYFCKYTPTIKYSWKRPQLRNTQVSPSGLGKKKILKQKYFVKCKKKKNIIFSQNLIFCLNWWEKNLSKRKQVSPESAGNAIKLMQLSAALVRHHNVRATADTV